MNHSNKGFTLIELMVVVFIIGILAAIAIPQFAKMEVKAKAQKLIDNNVSVTTVKDVDVKKAMIKMLAAGKKFAKEVNDAANTQAELNTAKTSTNNPAPATVETKVVPLNNWESHGDCETIGSIEVSCKNEVQLGGDTYIITTTCERDPYDKTLTCNVK